VARTSAGRLDLSLCLGCTQLRDGQLNWNSVLEGLVDLHHAIADGLALVSLPGVGQQLLLAMPMPGPSRDVKPGSPPEVLRRPAAAAASLTEAPKDFAKEQNIPFRDCRHVRRSFSQPGTGEREPAKPVSPNACCSKASELKNQALTETLPVGFEPTTGCLEGSCSIRLS
jgi:hypothetical protein